MLVINARRLLDSLREFEDQPVADKKYIFNLINDLIGQIERYDQDLASALLNHADAAAIHHRNLCALMRELEHLVFDDPLLLQKIGLIRAAFVSSFDRAMADLAALDSRSLL